MKAITWINFDVKIESDGPQLRIKAADGARAACRAVLSHFDEFGFPDRVDVTVSAGVGTARYEVSVRENVEYDRGGIDAEVVVITATARRV